MKKSFDWISNSVNSINLSHLGSFGSTFHSFGQETELGMNCMEFVAKTWMSSTNVV